MKPRTPSEILADALKEKGYGLLINAQGEISGLYRLDGLPFAREKVQKLPPTVEYRHCVPKALEPGYRVLTLFGLLAFGFILGVLVGGAL